MKRFVLFVVLSVALSRAGAQPGPFRAGDRVVFAGNSITDGGHYHAYIWLYYMTRFPNARIDIFNAGIGGDVAGQILDRLDDDVFSHKPTVIALTFGMNDTGYGEYLAGNGDSVAAARTALSRESYGKIEKKLLAHPEARKVMMVSSPYDETQKGLPNYFPGKAAAMERIRAFQQEAAVKNHWGFVDFGHPMRAINEAQQKTDSAFTLCGGDRIHPGNDGHMVMAWVFLRAQGLSGKPVATVDVDAKSAAVRHTDNCRVTGVSTKDGGLSFTYLANALPYPADTVSHGWAGKYGQAEGLKYIPFTDSFNRETLKIRGLEPGKHYALRIDSAVIGAWSGADWEAGVNLATLTNTPQYKQAEGIMYLNEERWEIERRLRQYYWLEFTFFRSKGMLFRDDDAAMDTLDASRAANPYLGGSRDIYVKARDPRVRALWRDEMALIVDRIYQMNKPRAHRIAITPEP